MTNNIITGPKGGQYWIDKNGKKHYIKRSKQSVKSVKRCCCCGKELSISDMNYYDLTNYCPKCALADGIITSLE